MSKVTDIFDVMTTVIFTVVISYILEDNSQCIGKMHSGIFNDGPLNK